MARTMDERFDGRSFTNIESSDTLWGIELVTGYGKQVHEVINNGFNLSTD
jgi:hypothetical protein